jgi:hypothetical protein
MDKCAGIDCVAAVWTIHWLNVENVLPPTALLVMGLPVRSGRRKI